MSIGISDNSKITKVLLSQWLLHKTYMLPDFFCIFGLNVRSVITCGLLVGTHKEQLITNNVLLGREIVKFSDDLLNSCNTLADQISTVEQMTKEFGHIKLLLLIDDCVVWTHQPSAVE